MILALRSLLPAAVGAIAAGLSVYLWMAAREAIVVAGAVKAERAEQVSLCNEDKRQMASTINDTVRENVRIALEAAGRIDPTPDEQEARMKLCKASSSCWEREEMP